MNVANVAEIEKLLNGYRAWLKDRTTLREVDGDWVEITTPYLDGHNDALQIYARRENGGYLLSDDSCTIHDLEASGCALNTEKRQDLLRMTLAGFGVKLNNEALEIRAAGESFPLRKHNLIQAMLAVLLGGRTPRRRCGCSFHRGHSYGVFSMFPALLRKPTIQASPVLPSHGFLPSRLSLP